MDNRLRTWLVVQLVPAFLGAALFAALVYVFWDTSLLGAAFYGVAFAAFSASARLIWWWLRVRSGRGTRPPLA